MGLAYFDNTASTSSVVEALRRDGAVVVTDVAESSLVDTVGAGDAFSSVLLLGLYKGWPLQQILNLVKKLLQDS